ncbi:MULTISPECIES: class I SAM-dependent methyltransferase [unclassified Micromonospora]|uniref:class I SAM-dependent methyltransferase n=1 Tax=unclassified Micromonospora TaxID=2617518 RepID=UPI0018909698|nr:MULTISPECIES: class I SAM-dependent methyltransferase [unclassified Micromonospora]MBF5031844.1 class I SAM-dependent methyltransferase [Micromonospora sp. ANENR4]MCZ7475191.1 class I SAM-dependent methyltransferase [Micromonospora sp. WMMC273]WBC05807.1 class I SAM-dependent methyltransferase [Micromonospora sp. WMMA1976]
MVGTFEELVAEAEAAPVEGWGFDWLRGRATEERPPWGYARLVGERMAAVNAALDIDTGGGEVLAEVPAPPPLLVATEAWPPNVPVARRHLRPLGASVVRVGDRPPLPFRDAAFDLVVSRHPVHTWWGEVARVLRPGGAYLSQQIGPGTMRELSEAVLGPLPPPEHRHPEAAVAEARAAGLTVVDLREATLRAVFHDIGAVVWFLRKVVWTVPGFTVGRYTDELRRLDERIRAEGPFVAYARRFLIEARRD